MTPLPRLAQSPTDPDFVQDPYRFYRRARAAGPMIWWDDYALPCATTYDAVNMALRDHRLGRQAPAKIERPPHTADFYAVDDHSMLELDPPQHTRLRSLVMRAFTSRRVMALQPEIEALADGLIDGFPVGGCDLVAHYAHKLPVIVIARLLGVPEGMAPQLLQWSHAMVGMYQAGRSEASERAAALAARQFTDYLMGYVQSRRDKPADDLITHLIAAEEDGQRLTTKELIATCILLLNAGHEATVHTLGNGILACLNTDTREAFLEDPETALEEVLRFDPPLHLFKRYAREDFTFLGTPLKRGDQIGVLLASANRDEEAFGRSAGFFDPRRPVKGNTSFGAGIHFCLGAPLARLELTIGMTRLLTAKPDLALTTRPRFANIYHFHGLGALPVTY